MGYIGRMEKKMEPTIMGSIGGFRVKVVGFKG